MKRIENTVSHVNITTNGIRLHAVEAGDPQGQLLIFLHGFPEFWYGWRKQIDFFARRGYHVVAPDQRGYNLSDKPRGISSYSMDKLVADIIGIIDHYGQKQALLVGHDWGAVVAWWAAIRHPERFQKLSVMNVPHPSVMREHLRKSAAQRKKSWYILFFQLPWLPEYWIRRKDYTMAKISLSKTSIPGTFDENDLQEYLKAWSQPGALQSMINWYRAALRRPPKVPADLRIHIPTLLIWGARDRFLGKEMAQPSIERCDKGELRFFEDATHWVHQEFPDAVNEALADFLERQ